MWFRKKDKDEGMQKEIRKEAERFRKLLLAYELLVSEGKVPPSVLEITEKHKDAAKILISIPDDYETAQKALTTLWDAYEAAESQNANNLWPVESLELYLNRARALGRVRCFNCLDIYDSSYRKCPGCGVKR